MNYQREIVGSIIRMIRQGPPLLQVLVGARQVGKTTAAVQAAAELGHEQIFAAADTPLPPGHEWIESHWVRARAASGRSGRDVLLVLDEIQKVRGWGEIVKRLWDEDRRQERKIHVMLLGSSSLLLQKGLFDSLAGRFFLHRCPHWSWKECRSAFGWDLEKWIFYGGYPGAAPLVERPADWKQYVADSLIETVMSRDVLALQTVAKPALLRHLFALSACFPAQVLSYNKMLGQLLDAGNATTLSHYLKLLETAFLVSGLELFSRGQRRKRGSSPKLVLWNQALISALSNRSFDEARADRAWWGRLVENAVGAHLLSHLPSPEWSVSYWRRGNAEVDYLVERGGTAWALEVKSGRERQVSGLRKLRSAHPDIRALVIGSDGIPLEEFLGEHPGRLLEAHVT